MKSNERQKMCTTCDGRIPLDANLCPYCAAEQGSGQAYLQHKSIQESLTSLYPPPYGAKNSKLVKEQATKAYATEEAASDKKFHQAAPSPSIRTSMEKSKEHFSAEETALFWPLFLLSVAANLLVIGLLQFFFSDNGYLTLQWNSRYWFVYCLAALIPFYIGFKKVKSI